MRSSLRCKAVLHDRHLLSTALLARSPSLRRAPCSGVHLQRPAARRSGPARRAVSRGGLGQHLHAPAALHVCHHPAAQQVLAVPAQELGHRAVLDGGVPGARRGDLAAGAALSAWGLGRRDVTQPVLGVITGLQLAYAIGGGCPETWRGFSSSAFLGLKDFVRLSVASGIMMWYAYFDIAFVHEN